MALPLFYLVLKHELDPIVHEKRFVRKLGCFVRFYGLVPQHFFHRVLPLLDCLIWNFLQVSWLRFEGFLHPFFRFWQLRLSSSGLWDVLEVNLDFLISRLQFFHLNRLGGDDLTIVVERVLLLSSFFLFNLALNKVFLLALLYFVLLLDFVKLGSSQFVFELIFFVVLRQRDHLWIIIDVVVGNTTWDYFAILRDRMPGSIVVGRA